MRVTLPQGAVQGPGRWIALAGAGALALLIALIALSAVDALGWSPVWERAHLTLTAGLAAAISASGIRGASGRTRRVRRWITLGLAIWFGAEVAHDIGMATGLETIVSPRDALLTVVALVMVATYWSALTGRLSRREELAVYLDGVTVLFAVAGVLILLFGPRAFETVRGTLLLAYAVVTLGMAGLAVVMDLATLAERRWTGAYAILVGLVLIGVAFTGKLTSQFADAASIPLEVDYLVSVGLVVIGLGSASWTERRDESVGYARLAHRLRSLLPLVAGLLIVGAAVVAGGIGGALPPQVEAAAIACGALVLVSALMRQTTLLAERDVAIRQEQSARGDLERSERRFRSLVHSSADVISVIGADGRSRYVSPSVARVLGYAPSEIDGDSPMGPVHRDDRAFLEKTLGEVSKAPLGERTFEVRLQHADGSTRVIEAIARNLLDDPDVRGIVVNWRDITERNELERQLEHQAFHDSLTGLANRALFINRLEHALARHARLPASLAVLFLDLDDFKLVNDTLGHGAGDELLQVTAKRLEGAIRLGDTAARLGGDEFAVLLEEVDDPGAAEVAMRVLEAVRQPVQIAERELVVQASVGIAFGRTSEYGAGELLRNADVAMYSAKGQGKGRFAVFEPGMHRSLVLMLELRRELHAAIEERQLFLAYQPVVALDTGQLMGMEALVRWRNPSRGTIQPDDFIPLAEESGLIQPLGRWVLNEACQQLQRWREASGVDAPPTISVNLSARQLADPNLVDDVRGALARWSLEPGALMLEVTESALIEEAQVPRLDELKRLGIALAVDDFGTGYSSLSYLSRLPFDMVKVDQSFVRALSGGPDGQALIRLVVKLGQSMKRRVVAEGVESPQQVTKLLRLGCTLGQGFYFTPPFEARRMTEILRQADGARPWQRRAAPPAAEQRAS